MLADNNFASPHSDPFLTPFDHELTPTPPILARTLYHLLVDLTSMVAGHESQESSVKLGRTQRRWRWITWKWRARTTKTTTMTTGGRGQPTPEWSAPLTRLRPPNTFLSTATCCSSQLAIKRAQKKSLYIFTLEQQCTLQQKT